ncbi:hypothetical protein F4778DRAFT_773745 [Xylariomycetidae sp. FL2044]|nr:hypothetical protein F4778DRAFT_773745 [Xylariomycetidae sp. FL2044]
MSSFYLPVLQDASSRANRSPARPGPGATKPAAPTNSRKRKSEASASSLEDDIAAYKQDLSHIDVGGMPVDLTCNQVRGKIRKLFDNGIMKKGEFADAIGNSSKSLNTLMSQTGTMGGSGTDAYANAWGWFKQRDMAGLKMPDVKKRQKTEASASASATAAAATTKATAGPSAATATDISGVRLYGEETDSVPVFDTCDEVRKKISAHLQTPGLTQAQFCRDIFATLHRPKQAKPFQSKQLNDFRNKKGPRAGCTSSVFYAAYVFFEKRRVAEDRPKSKHRQEMEKIWAREGGLDREHDGRHGTFTGRVICFAGERPYETQYGELRFAK